jgi:hypothetical protein
MLNGKNTTCKMITLPTMVKPNLITTVIAQGEVRPSEPKNNAIIANNVVKDNL